MSDKIVSRVAVAHIVVHNESDGLRSYNVMNFDTYDTYPSLEAAMQRVEVLVPTVRLVWERNATADVWSAYSVEYRLSSGRTIRLVRKPVPTYLREGF